MIVLLVVGSYDIGLITSRRHKRCGAFDNLDFMILDDVLQRADSISSTPHALDEASNLIRLIGEPLRSALTQHLGFFISGFREDFVPSSKLVGDTAYARLGLTDSSMLDASFDHELLTTDLDLYLEALTRGCRATNFAHLRERG